MPPRADPGWTFSAGRLKSAAMSSAADRAGIAAVLEWYQAMGVDAAVGAQAVDWLARGETAPGAWLLSEVAATTGGGLPGGAAGTIPQPPARTPLPGTTSPRQEPQPPPRPRPALPPSAGTPPRTAPALAAGPPDAAETAARTAARAAGSIPDLAAAIGRFDGCGLKATAKSTCVYRGAATARLAIVGEAPGRDEDLEGKPFVGRAGQLLDRMLAAIGMGEADVHITNIVYWRPPGNRTPTPHEAAICRPFLERQIELTNATHVLLLGGAAAKQVLDVADGIMRIRGRWHDVTFGARTVKAMATLHPAYLLRTPAAKRLAWRDLLAIKSALAQTARYD